MGDSLSILINEIKRVQSGQCVRGTRGYHYMASVAQTHKLSRVFDFGNHVINRFRYHGLERLRGDVVERKRRSIRAAAPSIV
jgi:hypothetical protein